MQDMESSAVMKVAKKEMDKENKMRVVKEEKRPSDSHVRGDVTRRGGL